MFSVTRKILPRLFDCRIHKSPPLVSVQTKTKQTPWSLVRKRTIPIEPDNTFTQHNSMFFSTFRLILYSLLRQRIPSG
jgi:hypothetical protein